MIAIEENIIYRDSEKIGQIVGTVAWMNAKQAGRIIGQIKQAAGIEGLTFEIVDTPEEKANLEVIPDSFPKLEKSFDAMKAQIESSRISAPEVVDNPPTSEPAVSCDDLAAGTFQGFKVTESIQAKGYTLDKMKRAQALVSIDRKAWDVPFGESATKEFTEIIMSGVNPSPAFDIPADFGSYEENPKLFAQCFINTYGPHGYDAWLKQKGL